MIHDNYATDTNIRCGLRLRKLHADRLDLRVVLQRVRPQFAAQSRLLETTKRHLVVQRVVVVHPDGSVASH